MIAISVGPANMSMPTRPNSRRLASATKRLPGPTSMSAARAGEMPERHGGDALDAAKRHDGVGAAQVSGVEDGRMDTDIGFGGEHTVMWSTPATFAVATLMIEEATWA